MSMLLAMVIVCSSTGYEDLVQAAELIGSPAFRQMEAVLPKLGERTWLEQRRQIVAKADKAMALLRSGLQKPVMDPHPVPRLDTPYPELVNFRTLSRLLCYEADVRIADGNPNASADAIADGFSLASAVLNTGGDLHTVTAEQIYDRTFACLERIKWQLTPKDLDTVSSALKTPTPSILITKIDGICKGAVETAKQIADDPDKELAFMGFKEADFAPEVLATWRALKIEDRRTRVTEYAKALASAEDRCSRILSLSEALWLESLNVISEESGPEIPGATNLWNPTSIFPSFPKLIAELNTRIRLARLECSVLRYRWVTGALPATLTQASPSETRNPQTNKDFNYELRGKRYSLWVPSFHGKARVSMTGVILEDG